MTELSFGVSVPTSAAPGDDPVGMAREAERLGYDFVSAADHPCGGSPSYETTIMLTWIAARTSRIKVASRVLGVPFRRPAMVAKLAASLDLLSGQRFILGLGAATPTRRSPPSKHLRAVTGRENRRPGGSHPGHPRCLDTVQLYPGRGATTAVRDLGMEPKPTSPIPVWLGTFGPRALAVTGRLADGWIPSLGYMPTEEFPAMRHRIDAAAEAGQPRRPDEIRSILNLSIHIDPYAQPQLDAVTGSATQVVSQLRDLLGLGFTGFNFILSGPDPIAGMQRIAEDVLPLLRSTG